MARNPKLRIDIDAQDKASKVIDDVADKAEKLDTMDAEVDVTADDQASDELADIRDKLERLDKDEAKVLLRAETKDARADLRSAQRELIDLDDEEAEVEVKADIAQAKRRLDAIQDEAEQLDRMDPDVDVSVKGGDDLGDLLDSVPGPMGDLVGGFQQLGPGGLIAGAGAAMFTLADHQANAAIDAQTFADLTGTTVEHASAMLTVFERADIELGDAADIALQLNGTLRDNPEYAEQLGINLNDGLNPAQRLVQVIDLMGTNTLNATDAADLFASAFGEEGVRQAGRLNTVVGDVSQAIEDIPEANIFNEEDVERAREFESAMSELRLQVQGMAAGVAEDVVPAVGLLAEAFVFLQEQENELESSSGSGGASGFFGMVYDTARRAIDPTYAVQRAIEDTGDAFDDTGDDAEGSAEKVTDFEGSAEGVQGQADLTAEALTRMADESTELSDAAQKAGEASDAHREALEAETDALNDQMDAIEEMLDQKRAAADSTWALHDAEDDFAEKLQASIDVMEDEEATLRDVRQAQDDTAESAYDLADASVKSARDATNGAISAAQETDLWNQSMIESARSASGPVRKSILGLIADYNNIPESEVTKIMADLDEADIDHVNKEIGNASRTRSSQVNVYTSGAYDAESIINRVARDRSSNIWVHAQGDVWARYGNTSYARGTPYAPGGLSLLGEEGPELVDLPMGASVTDAQASKGKMARMGDNGGGGGRGGDTYHIVQHFPPGINARDVAKAQREYNRRNA